MPYADPAHQWLPFQSGSDTSHDAAVAATQSAATQRERMTALYRRHVFTGLTDHEMQEHTGLAINVINARRNELHAVKIGRRMGPHGVHVTAWALEHVR